MKLYFSARLKSYFFVLKHFTKAIKLSYVLSSNLVVRWISVWSTESRQQLIADLQLTQEINEVTQQHIKRASTRSNSVNTSSKNSSPRSSLKHNLEALSKHTGEKKLFKKIPSLLRLKRNSNDSDDQSEEESSKPGSRKGSDDQENNQEKNAFYKYTKQILKLKKKESDSDTNYVTAFSTLDTYSDPWLKY